uniref:Dynein axonemal assembly factor 19 homolog n=2 Tax=Chlamydomonas reinhardtii TaxID=3055 RepID=PR46B_CHLRE|nr:RecName: Full=Coiled-coil domain-containing protein 103 homolog; AltName: Full=Protein PR46bp [Chlamydomonas reinhardtii]AAK70875.1 unknown [Chlamydomonas reinhardtii]ADF43150.1 PR46bp [Chlamydomonas reinhardtii]|eukprot:XP_001696391.1 predicted protein [Chlamydomonas reinhardtii]
MSSTPDHRPSKVSKELANAACDDFKRKAIDEAKKRAVAQRVDYDTFKNMVLTAHLKPITAPKQLNNDRPLPCWSFGVDGKMLKEQISQSQLPPTTPTEVPTTSGDFTRDWRRNCPTPDDKYRYLKLCGPEGLQAVFRVEISAEVLREMLAVLEACWLGHGGVAEEAEGGAGAALLEAAFVVQVLEAVSTAGRFSLTVKLLGSSAKPTLERLFSGLQSAVLASQAAHQGKQEQPAAAEAPHEEGGSTVDPCSPTRVAALQAMYGLPPS